ncbi:hypothetical protein AWS11_08975 [Campylobacter coli]|uniref:Uncharacterized protein n=3 Tax=Campylobacter coli TaxID=195 RepID=A0A689ZCJ2_CAMCO|nr:hypothetical protein [Campylobacter coli]EAI5447270.1 hypothetical protein [Campylobacter coli]EAI9462051.1 hypothetical protein [Campylobacter coli]EAJ6667813.1 hypothetical protein [Campylobacter coli]EAJ7433279.1 hypothetical protein [Campylobacter coli]
MFGAVKNPKNVKNIIKKKSKYATKQEVIEVLRNKYNLKTSKELRLGRSENVFWAKDNKQIKEIWEDIAERAEMLEDIDKDKLGGAIKIRRLSDGTIVKLRQKSKSGGSAVEIDKKPEEQIKIHSIRDLKK